MTLSAGAVKFNSLIGVFTRTIPWVPTPTEIMRRAAILDLIADCRPGSVLEIGCGSGALLYDLALRDFRGKGVEISPDALRIARSLTQPFRSRIRIDSELTDKDGKGFDYLFSISVLEHIEKDGEALGQWRRYLNPDGKLILAVPGHGRLWGKNDELAGHFRRYERSGLMKLVADAGFTVQSIYSYGYPVINVQKFFSRWIAEYRACRMKKPGNGETKREATIRSGIDRRIWTKLIGIYSGRTFETLWKCCFSLQRKFYPGDKGTGYVLKAYVNG